MKTDFAVHPPHDNYTATLKVRGTKEDFQELFNLLCDAQAENDEQKNIKEKLLGEITALVNWIWDGED